MQEAGSGTADIPYNELESALSDLRDVERSVDRQRFPERSAAIREELRVRGEHPAAEKRPVAPSPPRPGHFSHALLGLVLGQLVSTVYALTIAYHTDVQSQSRPALWKEMYGFAIPVAGAIFGSWLTRRRPMVALGNPWILALLWLGLLLMGLLDLWALFITLFAGGYS